MTSDIPQLKRKLEDSTLPEHAKNARVSEKTLEILSPAPSTRNSSRSPSRSSSPSRVKKYFCHYENCGKGYSKPSLLEQHLRSHTNERPFACTICEETFIRKDHLQRHMLKHTTPDDKPFHCSICSKGVNSLQHLKRHEKTHYKSFKCHFESCEEAFYKHQSLKAHINSVHDAARLTCTECGKAFSRPGRLSDHMEKQHSDTAKLICEYPGCFKAFKVWSALQLHIKSEHSKISCEICGKKCAGPTGLANHMKIHEDNDELKIWKCSICGERHQKKEELTVHYSEKHQETEVQEELQYARSNTAPESSVPRAKPGSQTFQKQLNKGRIGSVFDLVVSNVNERTILCELCGRGFKKDYDLKRHLDWHNSQKN
ncbi:hypothetical protein OGAPHI_003475 [Ogataea philodendri]|uniref:C2H2-type domain-containing protein n=1 Tax=Ogataea philodendri TaxID=1378263 RepID=A0A9P8P876_9ASCO|nr:uncharacterized protein OGAPHI_003475 [Ogataea philodendri]KAH3666479.1 hypothetical protein OGAPHI_003475 [Ogataea philodendri]